MVTDQTMATDRGLLLLIALCGVLLLTCYPPLTAASRISTAYERALLEVDSNKPQLIRAELMHRDHPDSPLRLSREATGSVADRYTAAAEHQKASIARRLYAGVEFTTPISFGAKYGQDEYVMTLYLGTPPQKFVVVVDTGSSLVWVQCQPCNSPYKCYKEADPFFVPSASSSYSAVPCNLNSTCNQLLFDGRLSCDAIRNCHITYAYGTPGSGIAGVVSTETLAFSNTTEGQLGISNFIFGCMDDDTASFGTVDGLAGFGRAPSSLPSQLSRLTSFNVFSYCLVAPGSAANFTSPLLFGASNSNGLQLVYTPILTDNVGALYWVNMTGISVNGTAVNIPQAPLVQNLTTGGTIMDSGTTLLTLIPGIYTPVVAAFRNVIPYPNVTFDYFSPNGLCYNSSAFKPNYILPNAILHFSGVNGTIVDLLLTGENLYLEFQTDIYTVLVCLGMQTVDTVPINIIGNYAQADHYVEYDLVNERIGWTPSLVDCASFDI